MRVLVQGMETAVRSLQEATFASPPGCDAHGKSEPPSMNMAAAFVSCALLLGGSCSCIASHYSGEGTGKKILSFYAGGLMVLSGISIGLATALSHND